MGIFSIFKSSAEKLENSKLEEQLYAIAASEIAEKHVSPGLWAKALATCNGNNSAAQTTYLRLRVEQLRLEYRAAIEEAEAAARLCCIKGCSAEATILLAHAMPMCQRHYSHYYGLMGVYDDAGLLRIVNASDLKEPEKYKHNYGQEATAKAWLLQNR